MSDKNGEEKSPPKENVGKSGEKGLAAGKNGESGEKVGKEKGTTAKPQPTDQPKNPETSLEISKN